jgi:hypothetical protein
MQKTKCGKNRCAGKMEVLAIDFLVNNLKRSSRRANAIDRQLISIDETAVVRKPIFTAVLYSQNLSFSLHVQSSSGQSAYQRESSRQSLITPMKHNLHRQPKNQLNQRTQLLLDQELMLKPSMAA